MANTLDPKAVGSLWLGKTTFPKLMFSGQELEEIQETGRLMMLNMLEDRDYLDIVYGLPGFLGDSNDLSAYRSIFEPIREQMKAEAKKFVETQIEFAYVMELNKNSSSEYLHRLEYRIKNYNH